MKPLQRGKSIAIVISPLVSLMEDQVGFLKSIGITAEFVGVGQKDEDAKKMVEQGECQIVYGSPEAFLSSKRWRAMLNSETDLQEKIASCCYWRSSLQFPLVRVIFWRFAVNRKSEIQNTQGRGYPGSVLLFLHNSKLAY